MNNIYEKFREKFGGVYAAGVGNRSNVVTKLISNNTQLVEDEGEFYRRYLR